MKKIALQFDHSFEFEIQRIQDALNRAEHFISKGYTKGVKLPGGANLEEVYKNKSIELLLDKAKEEYNPEGYEKIEDAANRYWIKYSSYLEKYFEETSLEPAEVYYVQLTKYGVGGSYQTPNGVIVNFQNYVEVGVIKVIIHEIVHLSIQQFVDKYKIGHWEEERVVDLILFKMLPDLYYKKQNVPIETDKIDKSFNDYYPDIEKIIKSI